MEHCYTVMEHKMKFLILILYVIPTIVTTITVSSNGHSPEIKMAGGMTVEVQKGFVPITPTAKEAPAKNNYEKSRKLNLNSTKLSINERYRRLIPYMTFYYANDLVTPTTVRYNTKNIEVEKAEIVEASALDQLNHRQPKKIVYSAYRNIPRYQGNRLTQYNIASANPTNIYKDIVPTYQSKVTSNYNPHRHNNLANRDFERFTQKQIVKYPSVPFSLPTRRPYLNLHNDDTPNVQYYLSEKEPASKYKLVPYEQTPPVRVITQNEKIYEAPKKLIPVPVLVRKEQVYIKPRPVQTQFYYDNNANIQQLTPRTPPITISENYYEKQRDRPEIIEPIVEGGFKPMIPGYTTETTVSVLPETSLPRFESEKHQTVQTIESAPVAPQVAAPDYRPENYYQYEVDQPTYKPPQYVPINTVTLGNLLNTLQLNKSIPRPITKENVGSSIQTLLQVLNALKTLPQQNKLEVPILSTPKPFVASKVVVEMTSKPVLDSTPAPIADDPEFHEAQYLAPVNTPSQHIDDFASGGGTTQQFPLPITSDDEGGTPGKPGVDYPILTIIPHTSFDCKTQRYKGFFADPDTRCQVWHYCDLNGGQASFLCPNGTIFSQAALTCDWWFNVRCASTAQLYVLNESLYKYILPHSPKFPEDYSGPLVDKYLSLKFKEMEEQFKRNKNKQTASEKIDSDEESSEASTETDGDSSREKSESDTSGVSSVDEASVFVQSPGGSGNVERLHD